MAHNIFGTLFCIGTWGESHGDAVGVIIDGCPAGLALDKSSINAALAKRAPGRNPYTTPRRELDEAKIVSGIFAGVTTGAPISIIIDNADADSTPYDEIKHLLRPGHANFTYLQKYGVFDHRGGGRASARETACRVAAGAVAQVLLDTVGIQVIAYLQTVGSISADTPSNKEDLFHAVNASPLFIANPKFETSIKETILTCKSKGDSIGGIVEFSAFGVPPGLGEPIYNKLNALLAHAMLSIPAAKGFEMGQGFNAARMSGSEHNDQFIKTDCGISTKTNHAGGTLGGISTGQPLVGRVAFKPTASIMQAMPTINLQGQEETLQLPPRARHDPCVAVRAVPVVEAMCRLVLADALLLHQAKQTWQLCRTDKEGRPL